jgi:oligoribonuclease
MLLWLDLETTGLIPAEDRILEIGWGFTTDDLDIISNDIAGALVTPVGKALHRDTWNPFVLNMHTESLLLADLDGDKPKGSLRDVENEIIANLDWIFDNNPQFGNEPVMLAGTGVQFDQRFIEQWMPTLHSRLSYRIFDVRTLQTFFFGKIALPLDLTHGEQPHRAVSDVQQAMEAGITDMHRAPEAEVDPR